MLVNNSSFDVRAFCQNLRATKPPYECPLSNCDRIYKTYSGIQFHLYNFEHDGSSNSGSAPPSSKKNKRGRWHHRQNRRSPTPPPGLIPAAREALTYAEAQSSPVSSPSNAVLCGALQKIVEVDLDGCLHRINICEPLDLVAAEPEAGAASEPEPAAGATGSGKAKLPEASFRLVPDYDPPDAPPRPASYYRFMERSVEELDEAVEYDMDEEDCAWLQLMNSRRRAEGLGEVSCDTFELLMDRLEKESYFQSQTSGRDLGPPIDEDAVCAICSDGECQNSNAILFCDMCNLAVHQECYGVPYIPEGQWLCRRCLQSPSRAVDCVLCPNKGGAFKQTDDGRWAHVVCALWVPEVCFANTVFLEPIDSLGNIPAARWKLTCYICKQRGVGACIQCHRANCYTAFHVTCAQQAGLYMRLEEATGLHVRKAAYCDVHAPAAPVSSSPPPTTPPHRLPASPHCPGSESGDKADVVRKAQAKAQSREKMRKARKILAEKRSAVPVVSIPTLPSDRLAKIATLTTLARKQAFLERLLGYWTLKRQSRNGVPLLRRLQMAHPGGGRRGGELRDADDAGGGLREQLKFWQRLRQDLERARLLVELMRKREKLKREQLRLHQLATELLLCPRDVLLRRLLAQLRELDPTDIFAQPVNLSEVPDYLNYIKKPMDFWTMEQKLKQHEYSNLEEFEADFHLIVDNCTTYNSRDTLYYKAAVKMREQGNSVISHARAAADRCGYDTITGMHLPENTLTAPAVPVKGRRGRPPKRPATSQPPPTTGNADAATLGSQPAVLQATSSTSAKEGFRRGASSHRRGGRRPLGSGLARRGRPPSHGTQMFRALACSPGMRLGGHFSAEAVPSAVPSGVNRRTSVLFRKKRCAVGRGPAGRGGRLGRTPSSTAADNPMPDQGTPPTTSAAAVLTPNQGPGPRKRGRSGSQGSSPGPLGCFPPQTDSFKVYRSYEQGSDSDRESSSESSESASSSSSDEATEPDEAPGPDRPEIPLEPLDLVWAKCRGYPWYPALIINPEMPRGGFTQNGVPIPVPPEEVLDLRVGYPEPVYLVLFFDTKRTWQWLPRNKLEPLGVDTARDKAKLVESKKPAERKAVKKAYENAILHRCRVTGQSTGLSGDSSGEDQ
ncbi:bromodomain-containing protein 140 isoform X3 [Dermacentor variabilis]|uniref:bromodomain-containing protein 140 isoform X3 n=1 Tax=Dermacentor variabilis TaxID=34621 RepID=UPI003F5C9670